MEDKKVNLINYLPKCKLKPYFFFFKVSKHWKKHTGYQNGLKQQQQQQQQQNPSICCLQETYFILFNLFFLIF